MATIKAYTTIEQSRKLAEILPLESADGGWYSTTTNPYAAHTHLWLGTKYSTRANLPAWSLAALLDILSKNTYFANEADMTQLCYIKATNKWCVSILNCDKIENCFTDNPVDACYEMILKLHEFNLL